MNKKIKIIDLFAGPGGLGEGFSSLKVNGKSPFKIKVSIEKDPSAHKTLLLRAFFRQFEEGRVPDEYYEYIKGNYGKTAEEKLFKKYETEAEKAKQEALCLTLGNDEDDQEIDKAIENVLKGDKDWLLIGGPPCQAYSLVGRARNNGGDNSLIGREDDTDGKKKKYVAEKDHRHFLYQEYLRIISKHQPALFVMENVKGILSAKIDGKLMFPSILEDLKNPGQAIKHYKKYNNISEISSKGYKVFSFVKEAEMYDFNNQPEFDQKDFIIKSENYGISQARHRVILLGIREDVLNGFEPKVLSPQNEIPLEEVIGDLPKLRSGLSKRKDTPQDWCESIKTNNGDLLKELSRQNKKVEVEYRKALKTIDSSLDRGNNFAVDKQKGKPLYEGMRESLKSWYQDRKMKGVANHQTRGHIESDLKRYLFCSCFAKANAEKEKISPKANDFPKALAPKHKNWNTGKFVDRFKVQVANKPATTITSHISKDGHYFIHYDPTQCRSLTVREAARIQTFPDNYFFEGNRTHQYVQVGNAVPPLLARQLAEIVYEFLCK